MSRSGEPTSEHPCRSRRHARATDEPLDPLVESYRKLADVFHEVLSEQSLDDLLERIARTVGELIPYDDITFYEADEAKRELRAVYASGTDAEKVLADAAFSYGVGITGWAAEHREPVLANRAELDPRVRFVANTTPDPESLIVVPLVARGRLKGTLNIYRAGYQEFTEDEFRLVVRFAGRGRARDRQRAHPRDARAPGADRPADRASGTTAPSTSGSARCSSSPRPTRTPVSLVMLDLDDFKRVNDVYSHATGDHVLARRSRRSCSQPCARPTPFCRIGGEEFAIIVPASGLSDAFRLAERVQEHVTATPFGPGRPGERLDRHRLGPTHAANPRELGRVRRGRDDDREGAREGPDRRLPGGQPRAARRRLARPRRRVPLDRAPEDAPRRLDEAQPAERRRGDRRDDRRRAPPADRLPQLPRVRPRGRRPLPIAFRGDLSPSGSAMDVLATRVGDGITGHVAATGEPFLTGDAAHCEIGVRIPGTDEIEESLLAVPFLYGPTVVGVIVVSKLGLDQFDADDLRLLEVLAGHVSVALVNARLYEAQRREAESAKALARAHARALRGHEPRRCPRAGRARDRARIMGSRRCSVWLPTAEGGLVCRATEGDAEYATLQGRAARAGRRRHAARAGASRSSSRCARPMLVARALDARDPRDAARRRRSSRSTRGSPRSRSRRESDIAARDLELLAGIASQARLAITNAGSFATLERTFLSTVEALANALEAKDSYTSSHTRWICDMAIEVGRRSGSTPPRLKRLELGALFHDIGKIGIPASILMKPGPLTAEERAP